MPIPEPTPTESREQFISRCMSDGTMRREFQETDQRMAVCQSQWQNKPAPTKEQK